MRGSVWGWSMRLSKIKIGFVATLCVVSCSFETPSSLLDKVPAPMFTEFSLNGTAGTITGNTIRIQLKWPIVTNLVATFKATGLAVHIVGIKQVSGVTVNDFTVAKTYTLVGLDGTTSNYNVSVDSVFPFADTGQTLCASGAAADGAMAACPNASVGAVQDGDFVNIPAARSFTGPTQHATFTSDYTTKDNVTGLVWKSCSEGYTPDNTCATAGTITFRRDNAGIDDASNVCNALNARNGGAGYAGLTNWRLPAVEELRTLVRFSSGTLAIESAFFPSPVANIFWTSSAYLPTPNYAWYVQFTTGGSDGLPKVQLRYVRCVASDPIVYNRAFTNNEDGTVTDPGNNLIWQRCSRGQNNDATCSASTTTSNWVSALSYCQGLSLAGRTWRLPSASELGSIYDYSVSSPAINAAYFPATVGGVYWTSSTYVSVPSSSWIGDFSGAVGSISSSTKVSPANTRCVATGP